LKKEEKILGNFVSCEKKVNKCSHGGVVNDRVIGGDSTRGKSCEKRGEKTV